MRKQSIAILLCAIIVVALAAYFWYNWSIRPVSPVQVGIFYYLWYNPAWDFSWNTSKIVDVPVLGYYNSSDPAVIRQHLLWMKDLGVDFVVISWWGFYDYYGEFIDNAAKQVFETAQSINSTLRFAIMVEAFNKTGNSYDYEGIYDHIYSGFVEPYSSLYYNRSKPLVCFFNNQNLTDNGNFPQDIEARFNTIIVGQQSYAEWTYTDLNIYDLPAHELHDQTSVTPRFDDSRFNTPSVVKDPSLAEGVYDQEWMNAIELVHDGKVKIIMITSWNEFVERTEIEPHYDATPWAASNYTDFLYNKTKDSIGALP